jgi:tRNA(Ile)-lysidine synthase
VRPSLSATCSGKLRGTHPERVLELELERGGVLRAGEHLLVACSGGADSVGLAALASAVAKRLDLRLTIGHVNHGVRSSAWQDEAVVLGIGAALGIPVKVTALTGSRRDEASLRDARYDALAAMARRAGASAVATAHTAQDQTETVLLALFRGTGPQGLSGMRPRRLLDDGLELVRPLLRFQKDDVLEYVQRAGLPYALDPTNTDTSLRRNAVRQALDALRPLFPGLDAAVARSALVAAEDSAGHPRAALRRQVREALREHEALDGVDFEHIAAAVRAIERGRSGRFAMASGVWLTIENGELTVHREMR